jgi:hypothetical protein
MKIHHVLCEVWNEAEETVDDLNRAIDHDQPPYLLLIWRVDVDVDWIWVRDLSAPMHLGLY